MTAADVYGYLALGCSLTCVFLAASALHAAQLPVLVTIWQALKGGFKAILGGMFDLNPASRPRFDIAAARRESHALHLPFPEADGTLSFAPEYVITADEMYAHVRDCDLISKFGVTSEEAMDAAYEALYGSMRDR